MTFLAVAAVSAMAGAVQGAAVTPILFAYGDEIPTALVVGASRGSKWMGWQQAKDSIKAGSRYRFFTRSGSSSVSTVGKPVLSLASGDAYNVTVQPFVAGGKAQIGLPHSVRWNLTPRRPTTIKGTDALRKSVAELLILKGLQSPKVEIKQATRCDLDGDGTQETLIEAHNPGRWEQIRDGEAAIAGRFSAVFIRQSNGKMNQVSGEISPRDDPKSGPGEIYELAYLFDLNGDGKMEIVIETTYYEGGGAEVYEWKSGKLKLVLEASDGL